MDSTAQVGKRMLKEIARCEREVAAWERCLDTPLAYATRKKMAAEVHKKLVGAINASALLKGIEAEKTTTYIVFHVPLPALLEAKFNDEAAMDMLIRDRMVELPGALFEELALCETSIHKNQYRHLLKSANLHMRGIVGTIVIYLDNEENTYEELIATPAKEETAAWTIDDVVRLLQHRAPDRPLPSDERINSLLQELCKHSDTKGLGLGSVASVLCPVVSLDEFNRDVGFLTRTCGNCNRRGFQLKVCSACDSAWYCNPNCQQAHWTTAHREECKKLKLGCARCGELGKLSKCSRCLAVLYCSASCQRLHWISSHKNACKKPS